MTSPTCETSVFGAALTPRSARAVEEDRIVAAADLDFANALRFPPGTHPGIVVLRVPDAWESRARAERLVSGIGEAGADTLRVPS
jgi:hypothetical protein